MVTRLANTIQEIASSPEKVQFLSDGAKRGADSFSWDRTVDKVYQHIEAMCPAWVGGVRT